jgi:pimeloyl-ACP methyl ester carboxylesterase
MVSRKTNRNASSSSRRRLLSFCIGSLMALALMLLPTGAHAADKAKGPTPCTSATEACTQWITFGKGPARSMVYSTYPLSTRNVAVRRALIMVHGTNRNPDHYFHTATSAAFLADALSDTVVIAPGFFSADGRCHDKLHENEVSWGCGGDSWRSGGVAASNKDLTSFDFVDELVKKLADKKVFPNLKEIVIAGHSAGGQFVNRYEMANKVNDTPGVTVSYVVSNPSSYAWPDATRPLPEGDAAPDAAVLGWKEETPHTNFTYGSFDPSKVPGYDKWPYGIEDRTSGYTAGTSDQQLLKQLAARPTTYLLSQVDTLPLGGFDGSPHAMAQGATRRARGEAFVKYINEHFEGRGKIIIIPECGHNDRCVYTTDSALDVIFPKP